MKVHHFILFLYVFEIFNNKKLKKEKGREMNSIGRMLNRQSSQTQRRGIWSRMEDVHIYDPTTPLLSI